MRSPPIEAACAFQLSLDAGGRSGAETMAIDAELLDRAAGRKWVCRARVRKGIAFLQHGSILLDGSQEIIAAVSRKPQVASTVTTLARILGRPVTFEEVADAIVAAWGDAVTSPNLHQPPPTSTTLLSHLAPLATAGKS